MFTNSTRIQYPVHRTVYTVVDTVVPGYKKLYIIQCTAVYFLSLFNNMYSLVCLDTKKTFNIDPVLQTVHKTILATNRTSNNTMFQAYFHFTENII